MQLCNRCCQHCYDIVTGMGTLPGAQVLWTPTLNQGLVRFLDASALHDQASDAHNKRTAAVMSTVNASGKAYFSGTTWRGKYAIRVSVVNWRTTAEDVAVTVAAVRDAVNAAQL